MQSYGWFTNFFLAAEWRNGGVFARYVWLNRLHYYAISYVAMLVYDAITTEWGLVSLVINFSNMMFIVTVALLVVRDKRLGKISMSQ